MLQREGDIGPRHRQPASPHRDRRHIPPGRCAGTCAAPARARTDLDDHARAAAAAPPAPSRRRRPCRPPAPSPPPRIALRSSAGDTGDRGQAPRRESPGRQHLDRLVGQFRRRVPLQRQRHSAGVMPQPSSPLDRDSPPFARIRRSIRHRRRSFSTSSFNALAGLSTTSPAAMRLMSDSGRRRIVTTGP